MKQKNELSDSQIAEIAKMIATDFSAYFHCGKRGFLGIHAHAESRLSASKQEKLNFEEDFNEVIGHFKHISLANDKLKANQ